MKWICPVEDDKNTRSYLKKVFCPNLCVGPSFQLLDILEYACGLILGPALTLSQNPIFEMASMENFLFKIFPRLKRNRIFALNFDFFTCLRITSHSGFSINLFECSKTH